MKTNKNRDGFSMVEVLVASTILIVIVMMMAMLFQQTSVAWRTGLIRANGFMQLRSYIGAIQRDASAAIDAKNLPEELRYSDEKQSFQPGEISFYTLTGKEDERTLKFITHDTSGKRTERVMELSGAGQAANWAWKEKAPSQILNFLSKGSSSGDDPTISPSQFDFKWASGTERDNQGQTVNNNNRLPLYISVGAEIVQRGTLYSVGAASAGPDMKWDTQDDIRTWVK